jgi:hypothetical protein
MSNYRTQHEVPRNRKTTSEANEEAVTLRNNCGSPIFWFLMTVSILAELGVVVVLPLTFLSLYSVHIAGVQQMNFPYVEHTNNMRDLRTSTLHESIFLADCSTQAYSIPPAYSTDLLSPQCKCLSTNLPPLAWPLEFNLSQSEDPTNPDWAGTAILERMMHASNNISNTATMNTSLVKCMWARTLSNAARVWIPSVSNNVFVTVLKLNWYSILYYVFIHKTVHNAHLNTSLMILFPLLIWHMSLLHWSLGTAYDSVWMQSFLLVWAFFLYVYAGYGIPGATRSKYASVGEFSLFWLHVTHVVFVFVTMVELYDVTHFHLDLVYNWAIGLLALIVALISVIATFQHHMWKYHECDSGFFMLCNLALLSVMYSLVPAEHPFYPKTRLTNISGITLLLCMPFMFMCSVKSEVSWQWGLILVNIALQVVIITVCFDLVDLSEIE